MTNNVRTNEIQQYAEAVIFAFEFKKPVKCFHFKGKKELDVFHQYINSFLSESNSLKALIKSKREQEKRIELILKSIII
jgi:hypothetical protein